MRSFTIDANHPCLPGHFPGNPVVPGVVVLDRVIAAIEAEHGTLPPLRLPQIKFVQPLLPGQRAHISLTQEAHRWRFQVHHEDALIASGDVQLATPNPAA